jgi:tetratricopeptide (TPR) repeat protein
MDDIPRELQRKNCISHYPFSSSLIVKKADLLIASRKYSDALDILEKASILDINDIDIYILKTDALLALDQQEKAVALLEEAIHRFDGDDRINLLFELADVYDDYEEFDKIFDCLKLILENEPNNEEALIKSVSGPILQAEMKKASSCISGSSMNFLTMTWPGLTSLQPTRV